MILKVYNFGIKGSIMSNYQSVLDIINSSESNTLFTAKDFYNVTNYQNAKLILNRMQKAGVLNRLIDGVYYKPKYIKTIDAYASVSPYDFAHKIALIFNWSICASGEAALNLFGLSTQISNNYVFESDGPYRQYQINGTIVSFKHTNNKYIKNMSYKVGSLIQALKYLGKEKINNDVIKKCSSKLSDVEKQELLFSLSLVPVWLTRIIYEIGVCKND